MDIKTLDWSDKMLSDYGIQKNWLPDIIKESSADFGNISALDEGLKDVQRVPISGVLGD